ncbi:MAG: radical SAM protein [Bdellovibrionales bacterium]
MTELKRYKNILAIKKGHEIWGYHTQNLEVAALSSEAWESLSQMASDASSEPLQELDGWSSAQDSEVTSAENSQKVTSYAINISQVCNLKCTYCAAGGDGTYGQKKGKVELEKVLPQLKMFLSRLDEEDSFRIHFIGGEPLLHPEAIQSVANYAQLFLSGKKIDLQFLITTNGTLMNESIAQMLAKLKCHVTVSFDGDPQENDTFRPQVNGKPSSEKVLAGLRLLESVRSQLGSLSVNGVFGDHNFEIQKAYKYYQPFQFDSININYSVQGKDSAAHSEAYIQQVVSVFEQAAHSEEELTRFSFLRRTFQTLDERERVLNHCGAGKSLIHADATAKAYTCAWLINDTNEQVGEGTQMNAENLSVYSASLIEKNNCDSCWAKYLCGGGCMAINKIQQGDKFKKDPHFCMRTRSLLAEALVHYGKMRTQMEEGA